MENNQQKVIGVILKGYPRLSETFILNEIYLLEQLGLPLHIFAMRKPSDPKVHRRVSEIKAPVTYIPDYFWRHFFAFIISNFAMFFSGPQVYLQSFWFAISYSIRHRDSATLKRFSQAAYLVHRGLPGNNIGFLYAHFANDPTTMTYFASRLAGLSYSISAHAKDIYLHEPSFLQKKISNACFLTTCTGFNATYIKEMFADNLRVLRTYHGIDLDMYQVRKKTTVDALPHILSIGRFVPKKGFPVMIKALQLLREQGFEFRCSIIGDGPMKQEMDELIARYGLTESVRLLPPMSQTELFTYYHSADIFALACEVQKDGDRDGIPNVIVESMALEIPVVATRVSGIPECVDHEGSGLLVPEKDPRKFADALARLLVSPALRHSYGKAGRKIVESEFDARGNIRQIADALQAAMHWKGTVTLPKERSEAALAASDS